MIKQLFSILFDFSGVSSYLWWSSTFAISVFVYISLAGDMANVWLTLILFIMSIVLWVWGVADE